MRFGELAPRHNMTFKQLLQRGSLGTVAQNDDGPNDDVEHRGDYS